MSKGTVSQLKWVEENVNMTRDCVWRSTTSEFIGFLFIVTPVHLLPVLQIS